jgi:hypothetical protein
MRAGCLVVQFCSRVCHKLHEKQHEEMCKALAAAAKAEPE